MVRWFGSDLREELGESRLRQSLGTEKPDAADLFRGEPAVARLAPHDLRMPVDRRRHLVDRQQVRQL
jgi:hypothetical protein